MSETSLCRLCAKKYTPSDLIKMNSDEYLKYNLTEKIHQYFVLNITEDDILPKDICNYCCKKVLETYEFHQKIEKAQEYLENTIILHTKIEIKEETNDNYSDNQDSYDFLFDNSLFENSNDEKPLTKRLKNKSEKDKNKIEHKENFKKQDNNRNFQYDSEIEHKDVNLKVNKIGKKRKKVKQKDCFNNKQCTLDKDNSSGPIGRELDKIIVFEVKEESFICERCGKSFPRVGILNAHLKTHSEDKPFKCDECPKFFKDIYGLKKHKMCHSGIRPHVCTVCGLKFSRKWIHDRHTLRHSKKSDFECRFCSKQFKEAYYLKVHLRQHTGERPYSCTECNHFFANSSNFIKHLRGKHRLRNFSIANQHQYPFVNN